MLDLLRNDTAGKFLVRLTVAVLMLFHGFAKIVHPGSLEFISSSLSGAGVPSVIAYGVYAGEVIAPMMILFGIHARIGGLIVVVNMLFAIALAHMDDIFSLTQHGGWALELQAFYLLGGLAVALLGSGKLAVKPD